MDYRLEKTPQGWKVLRHQRARRVADSKPTSGSFNTIVTQQGVDGCHQTLQDRNRQLANAQELTRNLVAAQHAAAIPVYNGRSAPTCFS